MEQVNGSWQLFGPNSFDTLYNSFTQFSQMFLTSVIDLHVILIIHQGHVVILSTLKRSRKLTLFFWFKIFQPVGIVLI